MKLFRRRILPMILAILLCFPVCLSAHAFTDLGTQPIELGDRVVVTVGPDQGISFTYTPPRNVRCNIYQDCDQYMALVHIAPFHMDSAQQHWSDDSPRKGVRFSLKAGVTYTMQIAMPAHFEGGTFNVYFDLVEWLPDNYFSSGASWDAVGNPQPDATYTPSPAPDTTPEPGPTPEPEAAPEHAPTPMGIEVTSPLTTPFYFGCEDYGHLEGNGRYVFSPSNYTLYEGLVFDILYSDGSRKTVTWNDLTWPSGTEYMPEGTESYCEDGYVFVVPFVDGESQFFPSIDAPGPVTFMVDHEGMFDYFTIDLLPGENTGSANEPDVPAQPGEHRVLGFGGKAELSVADMAQLAGQEGSLTMQGPEFTVALDTAALAGIAAQVPADRSVTLRAEHCEPVDLTTRQQETLNACRFAALVDIGLQCGDQIIHELGGTATLQIPYTPMSGTDPDDYTVYYLAEDGTLEAVPTTWEEDVLTFTTEHFSVYAVIYEESQSEPAPSPDSIPSPEPTRAPEPTETPGLSGLILAAVTLILAGMVLSAVVVIVVLFVKRRSERKE